MNKSYCVQSFIVAINNVFILQVIWSTVAHCLVGSLKYARSSQQSLPVRASLDMKELMVYVQILMNVKNIHVTSMLLVTILMGDIIAHAMQAFKAMVLPVKVSTNEPLKDYMVFLVILYIKNPNVLKRAYRINFKSALFFVVY